MSLGTCDIRLIASDLDGTLLNERKELTPRTLAALHQCEERGIQFVMSSGRTFEGIRLLARKAGLHSAIISANGGRVDASPFGPVLLEDVLPLDIAEPVFQVLRDSGLYIECYSGNTIYQARTALSPFSGASPAYDEKARAQVIRDEDGFEQRFVEDIDRMREEGMPRAYKFAAFSQCPAELEAIRRQLSSLNVTINSAFPFNIEIMERGKGKGRMITWLAGHLGLKREQVMAFGDGTNDLEMLRAAGTSVAMANGDSSLKAEAAVIAPSNEEDGVARVIEELVLGKAE